MMFRKYLHIFSFALFLLLILSQTSCEKFSGDQTVPAYLKIDSIRLTTDYSTQGTAMNAITDGWVYIDGQLIGVFQLPATFPVLQEGTHTFLVLPGIKKDGIAATRVSYPFYNEIKIPKTVNLVAGKTLNVGILSTTYSTKTKFLWREDFDDAAITLDSTSASTVKIGQTPTDSPLTLQGIHSGIVELDTIGATFAAASHSSFAILANSGVYLEMNFNTNAPMVVGVDLYDAASTFITNAPILTVNNTNNKWKKIYIDLSTALTSYSEEKFFKVYFYFENTDGKQYQIVLDNIKLLSF
ncbi:MAG: hypothetical protein ABSD71_11435 [Bacteroidales bacterium]|jgi:hypothetical protein